MEAIGDGIARGRDRREVAPYGFPPATLVADREYRRRGRRPRGPSRKFPTWAKTIFIVAGVRGEGFVLGAGARRRVFVDSLLIGGVVPRHHARSATCSSYVE